MSSTDHPDHDFEEDTGVINLSSLPSIALEEVRAAYTRSLITEAGDPNENDRETTLPEEAAAVSGDSPDDTPTITVTETEEISDALGLEEFLGEDLRTEE